MRTLILALFLTLAAADLAEAALFRRGGGSCGASASCGGAGGRQLFRGRTRGCR